MIGILEGTVGFTVAELEALTVWRAAQLGTSITRQHCGTGNPVIGILFEWVVSGSPLILD